MRFSEEFSLKIILLQIEAGDIILESDIGFYFHDPKHLQILRTVTEQYRDIGMFIIDPILEDVRAEKVQATREAFAPEFHTQSSFC